MKPIKITRENGDKIDAALAEVNGRATDFTIVHHVYVTKAAAQAEAMLDALPKAERPGASATFLPAGPSAGRWGVAAKSTLLHMERRATGWFLTSVEEEQVYPKQGERLRLTITEAQRDEIARRAVAGFSVKTN